MRLIAISFATVVLAGPVFAQQLPPQSPRPMAPPRPVPVAPAPIQPLPDRPAISLAVGGKSVKIVAPYGFTGSSDFKDHPVVSGYYPRRCRGRHLARARPMTAQR
jgi:hypothetical protein